MDPMSNCVCGRAIEDGDAQCAQCSALQELGLAAGATLVEVKAAHKMLVKVWHPDRFQSDPKLKQAAEAKLMAINRAFSDLTSEEYKGGERYRGAGGCKGGASQGAVSGESAEGTTAAAPAMPESTEGQVRERESRVSQGWVMGFGLGLVYRLLVLAVVLAIGTFFFNMADSYLATDPTMGRYYAGFKSKLKSDFEAARQRTWGELDQRIRGIFGGSSGTAPMAAPLVSEPKAAATETGPTTSGEKHVAAKAAATTLRLLPYVTVGLTRDEVESAQGPSTSSTSEKMMYGSSEVDLKDGKVAGWKVDPRSPLRVKLWPAGRVDASLRYFTVGSTKDEVLAVQGTPTSFSEDRFDYGNSSVYFRGKWVVDWKSDRGSIPLRAER